ncbi:hypothetical protein LX83_002899 [Goodfellowiella coeruleoviolacea]|uniref:Transcription factor zinc-finger domain-containing protein n=2 Tax=Goodfellowiella coeruleoviolacea TaxID=334858 RepID=A0AAE3KGD1_9PSEU|nr:hypothetical protein [Goodfellowiella coeruleoviolacea]
MRTYDRKGIHLEQCDHCRGVFLDWGELEQILRAEQQYYADHGQHTFATPPPYRPEYGHEQPGEHGQQRRRPRRGIRSFLEELFG